MAVAILPQAMIASVAMMKASIIVPESPMISLREISPRVRKNVTGIIIASIASKNLLFSWLARLVSVR